MREEKKKKRIDSHAVQTNEGPPASNSNEERTGGKITINYSRRQQKKVLTLHLRGAVTPAPRIKRGGVGQNQGEVPSPLCRPRQSGDRKKQKTGLLRKGGRRPSASSRIRPVSPTLIETAVGFTWPGAKRRDRIIRAGKGEKKKKDKTEVSFADEDQGTRF